MFELFKGWGHGGFHGGIPKWGQRPQHHRGHFGLYFWMDLIYSFFTHLSIRYCVLTDFLKLVKTVHLINCFLVNWTFNQRHANLPFVPVEPLSKILEFLKIFFFWTLLK